MAVIGGLSANYIYRTWIDPTANLDEQAAGASAEDESGETPPAETLPADTLPADAENNGHAAKDPTKPGDPREDAPVVNRVTEKAEPDAIPKQPDGLGISIDDLND